MDCGAYGSKYYETRTSIASRRVRCGSPMRMRSRVFATRASILSANTRRGTASPAPQATCAASGGHEFLPRRRGESPGDHAREQEYLDPADYTLEEALRDAAGDRDIGNGISGSPSRTGREARFRCGRARASRSGPPSYFSVRFRAEQSYPTDRGRIHHGPAYAEAIASCRQSRPPFYLQLCHHGVHGVGPQGRLHEAFVGKRPAGAAENAIMGRCSRGGRELGGARRAAAAPFAKYNRDLLLRQRRNTHATRPGSPRERGEAGGKLADERIKIGANGAGDEPRRTTIRCATAKARSTKVASRALMWAWTGSWAARERRGRRPIDLYPTIRDALGIALPARRS